MDSRILAWSYTDFVDDLNTLYGKTQIVCCPIRTGGGTRIKIIEAASYGKPVVSTRVGAEGLEFEDGTEILLRDEPHQFADEALRSRIGQAARAKATKLYDRRNVIGLIQREIFGSLDATRTD
jgi:glycosyltransferase involved in cell wall biosynthesis